MGSSKPRALEAFAAAEGPAGILAGLRWEPEPDRRPSGARADPRGRARRPRTPRRPLRRRGRGVGPDRRRARDPDRRPRGPTRRPVRDRGRHHPARGSGGARARDRGHDPRAPDRTQGRRRSPSTTAARPTRRGRVRPWPGRSPRSRVETGMELIEGKKRPGARAGRAAAEGWRGRADRDRCRARRRALRGRRPGRPRGVRGARPAGGRRARGGEGRGARPETPPALTASPMSSWTGPPGWSALLAGSEAGQDPQRRREGGRDLVDGLELAREPRSPGCALAPCARARARDGFASSGGISRASWSASAVSARSKGFTPSACRPSRVVRAGVA